MSVTNFVTEIETETQQMDTLKISTEEREAMRSFYQEERSKILARLNHVQGMLEKIGDTSMNIEINLSGSAEGETSTADSASSTPRQPKKRKGKKRGPKSVWGSFILKRLQQLDKPLTYNELVDEAMVFFKLSESKRQTVVNAINNSAFRLRKNSERIDTFSAGGREKYVALTSWFDEPGKINKDYLKKVSKPKARKAKASAKKKTASPKARTPKMSAPVPTLDKSNIPSVKVKSAEDKK